MENSRRFGRARSLVGYGAMLWIVAACSAASNDEATSSTTSSGAGGASSTSSPSSNASTGSLGGQSPGGAGGVGGQGTTTQSSSASGSTSSSTATGTSSSSSATSTSSSTSSATSSSSGTGGAGGAPPMCDPTGPVVETAGSNTKFLLRGTILTPTGPIAGEVYVNGNTIACVDVSCTAQATGATVIDTHGIVSPGLIDAHNHILFDIFDEDDWHPTQTYTNHNQWPNDPRYSAMVDAKQYLNGETNGSPYDLGCEMDKYGEMKGIVAGTTSIQGSPGGANKVCYGSIARTIDQKYNGLPTDNMQTATIFPSTSAADGVCNNFIDGDTTAYVVHDAEGVDTSAHNEFQKLFTISTVDGCLFDPKTTIIHGTALVNADFQQMAAHQMSLVWSPRSNVFLYGAGTDLTKTTNIPLALANGLNVSIGPDWSIGGSQNMLDELRFANMVDDQANGNILSSQDLWEMATIHPAHALGVSSLLGSLEVGKRADIAVFNGDTTHPYDAILAATPRQVTLTMVDGRVLYGDASIQSVGPTDATCETLDICTCSKFACVAQTNGTTADKLGQTFAQFSQILSDASTGYDALALSQWTFSPITPVVKCN